MEITVLSISTEHFSQMQRLVKRMNERGKKEK